MRSPARNVETARGALRNKANTDRGASRPIDLTVGVLDCGFFVESEGISDPSVPSDAVTTCGENEHENWNELGNRTADTVAGDHGCRLSTTDDGRRFEITGVEPV